MARFSDSSIGFGPLADRPNSGFGTSARAAWIGSSTFSAWEGSTWTDYGFAGLTVPGRDGALLIGDTSTVSGITWARRPESYPLFAASQATTYTWTPGLAYSAFGGSGQSNLHKRDFTYFSEARIYARGFLRNVVSGSILMKIVDTTNSVDITPDITFVDPTDLGVWADHTSAWTALNILTTGDCQYEARALSDNDALQSVIVGTISLELR
jgi:hypothetical protein